MNVNVSVPRKFFIIRINELMRPGSNVHFEIHESPWRFMNLFDHVDVNGQIYVFNRPTGG